MNSGDLTLQPSWPHYLINADPEQEQNSSSQNPRLCLFSTDPYGKAAPLHHACLASLLFYPLLRPWDSWLVERASSGSSGTGAHSGGALCGQPPGFVFSRD